MSNGTWPPMLLFLLLLPILTVDSESDGGKGVSEWQILTKLNFSSQIRLHPHILLMVTVPWCGESRSLMKELSNAINHKHESYTNLKLMLLYKNSERILTDALGATEGISIFYYRQGLSYKYQGRLRIQNILSSVHHMMTLLPQDLPLKHLNTLEEVKVFLTSTDKSLILLEFCGWTNKLLSKGTLNGTENTPGEDYSESNETNTTEKQKVDGNNKITCDAHEGLNEWFHDYTHSGLNTCTFEEFQLFEKFLPKFLTIVREFFLPFERLRFGVIHDRSLLPLINVEYSGSWFVTSNSLGCFDCSKVVKDIDGLKTVLHSQVTPVMELEYQPPHIHIALPANKASILLFIDRSSNELKIKEESKKALEAFRELAVSDQFTHGIDTYQAQMSSSKSSKIENIPAYQNTNQKDNKVSLMIMNEGKQIKIEHILSDLQGSSLQDIVTYVLEKKNQQKLSSIAKDSGFQLLSKDVDIKVIEDVPGQVLELSSDNSLQDKATSSISEEIITGQDKKVEKEENLFSFYFYDGEFRLLKSLTGDSKIPSLVIIDPMLQKHYVMMDHTNFNVSLLSNFLQRFINKNLPPYEQSEPTVLKTRVGPSPPLVNLDFREMDSIPRLTARTFSELMFGNKSDSEDSNEDLNRSKLVLFTNSWCAFCQRMELVVREVYRATKNYANMMKEGLKTDKNSLFTNDDLKLPLIYLMDCTLNDCNFILKSMVQKELYPSLLLFPAGSNNSVAYDGDITVTDIFKFLTDNGSLLQGLVKEKGMIWSGNEQNRKDSILPYEILLKERLQKVENKLNKLTTHSIYETSPQVNVGSVLIATEKLIKAHPFDESKILIVKVDKNTGFQGVIFNKHINWDSLEELEEGLKLLKETPLSFGGPIMKHGMPLVALSRKYIKDEYLEEVLPNIYFIDQLGTHNLLEEVKLNQSVSVYDYWFFLGYSSWGFQQLFDEIVEGSWNVTQGNMEMLDWPWR